MNTTHLLYLHGFRSSPQSTKARMVAARMHEANPGVTWWCPQLPPSPAAAMQLLKDGVWSWPRSSTAVIGSSLGGFYATCLAAQLDCHVVVLNPAVHPSRDLAGYVGSQSAWHDENEHFVFEARYLDELRALESGGSPDPAKVLAVIARGDELLDWREMRARYPGARVRLLEGSDHAISDFADHIDEVFAFLGLR
ncbi:MAG: YqiA/YcfP family alpha/beta fold hydrolase [Pseudomonadota bacterium]